MPRAQRRVYGVLATLINAVGVRGGARACWSRVGEGRRSFVSFVSSSTPSPRTPLSRSIFVLELCPRPGTRKTSSWSAHRCLQKHRWRAACRAREPMMHMSTRSTSRRPIWSHTDRRRPTTTALRTDNPLTRTRGRLVKASWARAATHAVGGCRHASRMHAPHASTRTRPPRPHLHAKRASGGERDA